MLTFELRITKEKGRTNNDKRVFVISNLVDIVNSPTENAIHLQEV